MLQIFLYLQSKACNSNYTKQLFCSIAIMPINAYSMRFMAIKICFCLLCIMLFMICTPTVHKIRLIKFMIRAHSNLKKLKICLFYSIRKLPICRLHICLIRPLLCLTGINTLPDMLKRIVGHPGASGNVLVLAAIVIARKSVLKVPIRLFYSVGKSLDITFFCIEYTAPTGRVACRLGVFEWYSLGLMRCDACSITGGVASRVATSKN